MTTERVATGLGQATLSPSAGLLPGAIGVSRLRVYSEVAVDGVVGGTPHVHLVCSEGYYVVGGRGAVHTLTGAGEATVALHPGVVAWFTPGTVHRLANEGDLEIVTLMQNGGLPEAGDAVLTFPAEVLADPRAYGKAATLGPAATPADAYRRRDLAVEGLRELRQALEREGPIALERFYAAAARIVRPRLPRWRRLWNTGPQQASRDTAAQMEHLEAGDVRYLLGAMVNSNPEPEERGRLGMCGLLDTYPSAVPQQQL